VSGGALHALLLALAFALPLSAAAQDAASVAPALTGQALFYGEARQRASGGPLAQGHRLAPEVIGAVASSTGQIDASLRLKWRGIEAAASALGSQDGGAAGRARLRLDELFYARDSASGLRLSVGQRVVSWDVGYAFRPNDLIQDEARRALVTRTLQGRPLLMLEGYGADTAWAVAAAHYSSRVQDEHPHAPSETLLAARLYRHAGAADLYGFAAIGTRSRATVGAAFSWVLDDAMELHGSWRWRQRAKVMTASVPGTPAVAEAPLYADVWQRPAHQIMLGGTWSSASRLSLIVEGWYDATAPSNRFWSQWAGHNAALAAAGTQGAPLPAVAGNYGWQAEALSYGPLRRTNLYVRLSWQHEGWEPTLDALYMPADGGLVITAGLAWSGERIKLNSGIRLFRGPSASLARQLPIHALAYVGLSVAF
jgi:hypothetical protein